MVLLWFQIWLPRVAQALLAAFADVKFYRLIRTLETEDVSRWTVGKPRRCHVPLSRTHSFPNTTNIWNLANELKREQLVHL